MYIGAWCCTENPDGVIAAEATCPFRGGYCYGPAALRCRPHSHTRTYPIHTAYILTWENFITLLHNRQTSRQRCIEIVSFFVKSARASPFLNRLIHAIEQRRAGQALRWLHLSLFRNNP